MSTSHNDDEQRATEKLYRRYSAANRYADHVLHLAWLRGAADLLYRWEQHFTAGYFGSAGLGLLAANLLDHAHCLEDSGQYPGPDDLHECPPAEYLR